MVSDQTDSQHLQVWSTLVILSNHFDDVNEMVETYSWYAQIPIVEINLRFLFSITQNRDLVEKSMN
jgi:hypothetical protein